MRCGAFDSGLTIHPDGKATPCCLFDLELAKNINELNWNDPWKDLRDGRGCDACKKPGITYKNSFDRFIQDDFSIKYLDIRNNNLCNLECAICNSYYSSKWAERLNLDQKFVNYNVDVNLDEVEQIYFAGGEPFLNKTHWDIINKIKNPQNVSLLYNTNLTYINNDVIDKWKHFKRISVNASLDGIGEFGEYIRPGLNFSKWEENLNRLKQSQKVQIDIACTVSILNIWHLQEMKEYFNNKNINISFHRLDDPDYLSLSALPLELKEKINYIPVGHEDLLAEDKSHLFIHSISNILLGDKLRKTNLWKYLPYEDWAKKHILDY